MKQETQPVNCTISLWQFKNTHQTLTEVSLSFVFHTNLELDLKDNRLRSGPARRVHEGGQRAVTAADREPLMPGDLIKVMQNEEVCELWCLSWQPHGLLTTQKPLQSTTSSSSELSDYDVLIMAKVEVCKLEKIRQNNKKKIKKNKHLYTPQ